MSGKSLIVHIVLAPEEVKNKVEIDWPISWNTAAIIEVWLKRYRPTQGSPGNLHLFPGLGLSGKSVSSICSNLSNEIEQIIGCAGPTTDACSS